MWNTVPKVVKPRNERKLRIHQALARQLGTAILSGVYKPGQGLNNEIELSAELSVSRTAYREAMRILTAKGLIESRPKIGTQITPRSRWNFLDPDILAWMFSERPNESFVRDLFELRGLIEPAAAAFAATRRTSKHLAGMQRALEGMRRHGLGKPEGREADRQFHHLILDAAGNEALRSLSSSVEAAVTWTTYFKQRKGALRRDPLPAHEGVFRAIKSGNPGKARRAMETLLAEALEDMGYGAATRKRSGGRSARRIR